MLNILLGTCWSHTAENLRHSVDGNQLQSYIDKVKKAKMNVSADVQCYHFERKTTGSGKNRKTRTVKKVTHRATENFVYEGCLDKSPSRLAGDGYLFVRVESRVLHEFGDGNTGRAYLEMCSALFGIIVTAISTSVYTKASTCPASLSTSAQDAGEDT